MLTAVSTVAAAEVGAPRKAIATEDDMDANLKDLETRGFVVIPSFLSYGDLQALRDDFLDQPLDSNGNYKITAMSSHASERFSERVAEVLTLVRTRTDLQVDLPQSGAYFATGPKRGMNFHWHQDHESFFLLQNHYDYLNFYLPIIKPQTDKSNLSIVPFDVLERECPKMFRDVVRSGAREFVHVGTRQVMLCNDSGTAHFVPHDMDQVAHTPALAAGDLLLMRGDVIHKTQDAETERVALSFRAGSTRTVVKRWRLAAGGLTKAITMANNPAPYQRMFKAFDTAKRNELCVAELGPLMESVSIQPPARRRDFVRYLMTEKRRAHVLGRFFGSMAYMKGFGAWAKLLALRSH